MNAHNRIHEHDLIGTTHVFHPDLPPYDAAKDTELGVLVLGNGMTVEIEAVFTNWNDVPGLDMLYVYCPATGYHTHVTPADLNLPALSR